MNDRQDPVKNYRNGSYARSCTAKTIGNLRFRVSRDLDGKFHSKVISRYERYYVDKDSQEKAWFPATW